MKDCQVGQDFLSFCPLVHLGKQVATTLQVSTFLQNLAIFVHELARKYLATFHHHYSLNESKITSQLFSNLACTIMNPINFN